MSTLSRFLWLAPFAAQIAYILATYDQMPRLMGASPGDPGTRLHFFIAEWFAVVGIANIIFVFVHLKLHTFSDRMLSVPGKAYWLATEERRRTLLDRLRGILEVSLFLLNVFFLAVYQSIYQTNVTRPLFQLSEPILLFGFMILPVAIILAYLVWSMLGFAKTARDDAPSGQKESKNGSKEG